MNTDEGPDLTGSGGSPLLCKKETKAIIGCAFEVLNSIGHGLHEKVYENALVVAFRRKGIPFDQQRRFGPLLARQSVSLCLI
jgi:GxxExxY protein